MNIKSTKEIALMTECGKRLKAVVKELMPQIKVGITTEEIDDKAEKLIKLHGGESSFKSTHGYLFSTCTPINEQIVHTKPSNRLIQADDVLTLDIGMLYKGWHTDYAVTSVIGGKRKDPKVNKFLKIGEETLYLAIKEAKIGGRLGSISKVIESEIVGNGYFIIKELTGHGIGRKLHEDPYIFGFVDRPVNTTSLIKKGLVVAIEIIYAMGTDIMIYEKDNWSIITKDRSLSACFEHTIAVTDQGPIILT